LVARKKSLEEICLSLYFFCQSKEVIYVFSESSNIWIFQTLYVWLVFTTQLGWIAICLLQAWLKLGNSLLKDSFMLVHFAKIAGSLRLLISKAGAITATSLGLLSARSVAYFVGFGLGSIASAWLPIVAVLISVTWFLNAGANTPECEAFRAQMRAIYEANCAALAAWQIVHKAYIDGPYKNYLLEAQALALRSATSARATCAGQVEYRSCVVCAGSCGFGRSCCVETTCYPRNECENAEFKRLNTGLTYPNPPTYPRLQTYPACSSPNCPPGKKVWTQVIWGSPSGNFTDSKGCCIVAYSQDAPTLPPKVEYNPFLPKLLVESRAISYYLVNGDRYRGLQDNDWKNLESVQGWDKGYWRSEATDSECRGWRPGWSKKVK
jgi:hypothetical protein